MKKFKQRAGAAFPVQLRSPTNNGTVALSTYSALPLDDNDTTDLYLFEGDVKTKNIVGILPVTRESSMNICASQAEVLYGECHTGACDIEAILLPDLTYRIANPRPVTTQAATDSESWCDKLNKQNKKSAASR
jgi:hypothetical protein